MLFEWKNVNECIEQNHKKCKDKQQNIIYYLRIYLEVFPTALIIHSLISFQKACWNTLCLNKFSCWGEGISKLPFSKRSWSGVHIQAKELFVIETVSEYMKYRQPTCWDYLHLRKEALPNISSFITYLPFCSRYNSVLSLSIANCFHQK